MSIKKIEKANLFDVHDAINHNKKLKFIQSIVKDYSEFDLHEYIVDFFSLPELYDISMFFPRHAIDKKYVLKGIKKEVTDINNKLTVTFFPEKIVNDKLVKYFEVIVFLGLDFDFEKIDLIYFDKNKDIYEDIWHRGVPTLDFFKLQQQAKYDFLDQMLDAYIPKYKSIEKLNLSINRSLLENKEITCNSYKVHRDAYYVIHFMLDELGLLNRFVATKIEQTVMFNNGNYEIGFYFELC